jgi:hypothetical protein
MTRDLIRSVFRLRLLLVRADLVPLQSNPLPLLTPDDHYSIGDEARARGRPAAKARDRDEFFDFIDRERIKGEDEHYADDIATEDGRL